MNKNIYEFFQVKSKHIIKYKFILLLTLIFLKAKFKKFKTKQTQELFKSIPSLNYFYIDLKPYKEIIFLENKGTLEIYTNNDTSKEIISKNSVKIIKSKIVFLVIPGGSYRIIGEEEALPVAKKFFSLGYSSAILRYSVYTASNPTQYNQGLSSIKILSAKFEKIIIVGFSAGGHLAGLLGTSGKDKLYKTVCMILCYPVISFINNVHNFSRYNFFGQKNNSTEKEWKLYSIENRVNYETIPTFIWTIKNDEVVPYENTLYMINSLKKYGIKHEYKIYKKGEHGMALADEFDIRKGNINYKNKSVSNWFYLAINFVKNILKNN